MLNANSELVETTSLLISSEATAYERTNDPPSFSNGDPLRAYAELLTP